MATLTQASAGKYWTYALWLAMFTSFYNLAEGLVSIFFGISDEALTLFGFSNEGKEAFEKAAGMEDCCDDDE